MMVEFTQDIFNKAMLAAGLSEKQIRRLELEFTKNNLTMDDEALLEHLTEFGLDLPSIMAVFSKLGLGKATAITMVEMRQKKKLGKFVEIYDLEVVD